ncbi:MAG: S4 domain-containing protein [Verrucomicrobiota bacterium]|jgi:ribosome-associated heat shock protein Hsp15
MRLDVWLWCIRAFKTRSLAVEAIRAGRVSVDGVEAKPSKDVTPGQVVSVKTELHVRVLRALALPRSRVGAALVPLHAEDQTPPEVVEAARQRAREQSAMRPRGLGRPTKRDRRRIDALQG